MKRPVRALGPWDAPHPDGLVLRPWVPATAARPLVACVILRAADLPFLLARAGSWQPAVDRMIVVLGAWSEPEAPTATRNAATAIRERFPTAELVMPPPGGWKDQIAKRSAYFARLSPGEVGFVVDADEELVEGPAALRTAAQTAFDVGWVTISAQPRYKRPYGQPRLFLAPPDGLTYRERHYWVFTTTGRLVAAHRYGGTGWLHARLPLTLVNRGGHRKPAHSQQYLREQRTTHSPLDQRGDVLEGLRIVQLMRYDAGLAAYRLHSAINATTRERSLMVSDHADNPLRGPTQFDIRDRAAVRPVVLGADVLHCHVDYQPLTAVGGARGGQAIVMHHHGSVYRADPRRWDRLDTQAVLRLGSTMNLLLLDTTHTLQWLPNPVPVALYARMAAAARRARQDAEVWIAHSPSKPKLKGTADLLAAVERLRAKHLPVQLQILQGMPHADALWRKASCDIMFDSFWLGIQCSGLEAAAMGMPVVAGDADTAAAYRERLGSVPYTFADPDTLDTVLERLVVDVAWRNTEAARCGAYVLAHHDEAAVARRYLELLTEALHGGHGRRALAAQVWAERRERATLLRQEVEPPVHPAAGSHFRLGVKTRGA